MKLRWTRHCVLTLTANYNTNDNPTRIIFTIKDTKLFVAIVTLSAKGNQKLWKLLSERFERSVYWNKYKTKLKNENTTNEYRYFPESNFVGVKRLFVFIYPNQNDSVRRFNDKKYYLPKDIIRKYNLIINGKNFYDQPVDSDIKRYK